MIPTNLQRFVVLAICLSAQAAIGAEQYKPSFDCSKAETAAEIMICDDEQLARLDRELASLYREARTEFKGSPDLVNLKRDQRAWLRARDDCMAKRAAHPCVVAAYTRRIGTLHDWLGARP